MVTRRSFLVRAFAGGVAAALPAGQVAAAIAPQSMPEPISIAPGIDVIDGEPVTPIDQWGYDEWLPWLQEKIAELPGADGLELEHKRLTSGPNAGGFTISRSDLPSSMILTVNPESGHCFMALMSEGGAIDHKWMRLALLNTLLTLAD